MRGSAASTLLTGSNTPALYAARLASASLAAAAVPTCRDRSALVSAARLEVVAEPGDQIGVAAESTLTAAHLPEVLLHLRHRRPGRGQHRTVAIASLCAQLLCFRRIGGRGGQGAEQQFGLLQHRLRPFDVTARQRL